MEWHPICSRYRDMTAKEYAALRDSIKEEGRLHVPILLWQGKGADGRHRFRACEELGIEPAYEEHQGDEASLLRRVDALNRPRRHLTPEQQEAARLDRIPRIVKAREEGKSLRAIAEEEGISLGQVQRDLADAPGVSPDTPESVNGTQTTANPLTVGPENGVVTGRDGRQQSATKKKPAPCHEKRDEPAEPDVSQQSPPEDTESSERRNYAKRGLDALNVVIRSLDGLGIFERFRDTLEKIIKELKKRGAA